MIATYLVSNVKKFTASMECILLHYSINQIFSIINKLEEFVNETSVFKKEFFVTCLINYFKTTINECLFTSCEFFNGWGYFESLKLNPKVSNTLTIIVEMPKK